MTFSESGPWKNEVGRCAQHLRKFINQSHPQKDLETVEEEDERIEETFQIEKNILLGCIAVRRLLEMTFKTSTGLLEDKAIPVTRFPLYPGCRPPDQFDALTPFRSYNLYEPVEKEVTARDLCNLFIHSHVQVLHWELDGASLQESLRLREEDPRTRGPLRLAGVFVTTDRRKKHLLRVDLRSLIECFEEVAADDVTYMEIRRDEQGEWKVISARNEGLNRSPQEICPNQSS